MMDLFYRLLIFTLALVFILVTYLLKNNNNTSAIIVLIISVILLIWKCQEFSINIKNNSVYPIEFSHISYFVLSIIAILGLKPLYLFGGSCGLISGIGYYITFFISPQVMQQTMTTPILNKGLISHSFLFFAGLLLIFNIKKFKIKEYYFSFIGLSLIYLYGFLALNKIIFPNAKSSNYVFLNFLSAYYLSYLTGTINNPLYLKVIFVIFTFIVVSSTTYLFYILNQKFKTTKDAKINGIFTFFELYKLKNRKENI